MKNTYLVSSFCIGMMFLTACGSSEQKNASETSDENAITESAIETPKGKQLIDAADCRGCHAVDSKVIGPSYIDVAKKYENNEQNVTTLAKKIIQGGQGNWGEVPMTPHPDLSEDDAKQMVQYILSIKP